MDSSCNLYMNFNNSDEPNPKRRKGDRERTNKAKPPKPVVDKNINDLSEEILTRIFQYVDTPELVHHRVVSRKWCRILSEFIYDRGDAILKFDFDLNENLYVLQRQKEIQDEPKKSLLEFTRMLKKSKFLIYNHFFFPELDLSQSDVLDFFKKRAEDVKTLEIRPPKNQNDVYGLKTVLKSYAPNIEKLIIGRNTRYDDLKVRKKYRPQYSRDFQLFPEVNHGNVLGSNQLPILSKLKSIQFNYQYQKYLGVVSDLCKAAFNLQEIKGPWEDEPIKVDDFKFLSNHGKLGLINKHVIFDLCDSELNLYLTRHPYQLMKCKRLSVRCITDEGNMKQFLPLIMENSKDTLKQVDLDLFGNVQMQWHWLENVTKLTVVTKQDPFYFFSGLKLEDVKYFAKMEEMDITCNDDINYEPPMDFLPSFVNVKRLSISAKSYCPKYIDSLVVMFPSATTLILRCMSNFLGFMPNVIKGMKQLENLQLQVPYNDVLGRSTQNLAPVLDVICSGYSVSIIGGLNQFVKTKRTIYPGLLDDYDREFASIFDLPNLRFLKIKIYEYQCCQGCGQTRIRSKEELNEEMISVVASMVGYNLLPNLNVLMETCQICVCCM